MILDTQKHLLMDMGWDDFYRGNVYYAVPSFDELVSEHLSDYMADNNDQTYVFYAKHGLKPGSPTEQLFVSLLLSANQREDFILGVLCHIVGRQDIPEDKIQHLWVVESSEDEFLGD